MRATQDELPGIVRILIVDDHPVVRAGLVDLFESEPGLAVSADVGTIAAALAAVSADEPNVAVIDLALGNESGLDLVAALARTHPAVRTLVLSGQDEQLYAERTLKAGALGYVQKDSAGTELLAAVRRVAAGRPYVSPAATERILSNLGGWRHATAQRSPFDLLSDRERHVLMLLGRGLATEEIAQQLGLSVKTVESHCAHLREKLEARSGRELAVLAARWADGGSLAITPPPSTQPEE